jgi:hypothetical protein
VLHMKIIALSTSNIMFKNYIIYACLYYPVPVKISFYLEIRLHLLYLLGSSYSLQGKKEDACNAYRLNIGR